VIHASWFDTTIDIPRELSAKDQILSAGRAGIRKNEMLSLRTSELNPMIAHVNRSMHSSCQTRPAFTGVGHRSARGPNYCGPLSVYQPDFRRHLAQSALLRNLGLHDNETWYATRHNSALRGARRGIRCGTPHFCA